MANEINFNLAENAEDSIQHAIDLLAYSKEIDESSRYKRSILSISQAIELLLKERLRQIHPSLIWDNVDKFPDLDGRTVTSEKAVFRLKRIGGLEFTTHEEKLLHSLKKTRNAIEHYVWSISKNEAEYIIGSTLSFAIIFAELHLNLDLIGFEAKRDGTLSDLLSANAHFKKSYNEKLSSCGVKQAALLDACGFCSALIGSNDGACKKCGHWNTAYYENLDDSFDDNPPF